MMAKRQRDPGLDAIAKWHRVFCEGHRQRLAELNLPREQHERELAAALRIGDAVAAQMQRDYEARRHQ